MKKWAAVLIFGCAQVLWASPEESKRLNDLALDRLLEGQARVMALSDRVRIAGAELCGKKVAPVLGIFAVDTKTIDDMWRDRDFVTPFVEAAEARWDLRKQPRIMLVAEGLPAAEAGLQPGDLIVELEGKKVRRRILADVMRGRGKSGTVSLVVERDGERVPLEVEARMGCSIPSRFVHGSEINAFATSFDSLTGIYFYDGLLRYFPGDDEVGAIVGHELAHHILGHTGAPRGSERLEAEADYLGLYLAARAGFDIEAGPRVDDGLALVSPYGSIQWGYYSHPVSARRSIEQRATIAEIEGKRARGEPLVPNKGWRWLERPEVDLEEVDAHLADLRRRSLARFRQQQARVQRIAHQLARGGREVCGEQNAPLLGASLGRTRDFSFHKKEEIEEAFGAGDEVALFALAPGSPAETAGLAVGDRILAIDGQDIGKTQEVFEQLRANEGDAPRLRVRRGGETRDVTLPLERGCGFGALTLPNETTAISYHRNRKEFLVPSGLERFVESDDELAIAIAHQMGHHVIGSFRSKDDETEADRLGLEIAAASGYDVTVAPVFWERWAASHFWAIASDMDGTYVAHGAVEERLSAIREHVAALTAR